MKHIEVTCERCNGTGRRRLSKQHIDTLQVVASTGMITAEGVHTLLDETVGVTAISKRLQDLHALGLVKFEKAGKQKMYSVNF